MLARKNLDREEGNIQNTPQPLVTRLVKDTEVKDVESSKPLHLSGTE